MCRHLGWLGAPRSVADLVLDQPHGLLQQSYAPRRQAHGRINADGWGVGFYPADREAPARWRSSSPLWGEASFPSIAPVLTSRAVVAAVRSATVGMPIEESASAPFRCGPWLLSLNGRVSRDLFAPDTWARAESSCDAALLAVHVADRGFKRLGDTVAELGARDPHARLNVLATDGTTLSATTWGDTLSVLACDDGVAVASEPYDDDPRWVDVPNRHLVTVRLGGDVTVEPLA